MQSEEIEKIHEDINLSEVKQEIVRGTSKKKIDRKIRKSKLRAAYMKVSIISMLLIVSTYAWFTSQKDISLSNLRGTVEVAENMEISLDGKKWSQEIDLSDATLMFEEAQESKDSSVAGTAKAILPTQLLPVSSIGEKNSTIMPIYRGVAKSTTLEQIEQCVESDGSGVVDNGYYAFDIYIKNTSRDVAENTLQLNLNSAVQVIAQNIVKDIDANTTRIFAGNAASGLQNTVRVGLALYNGEVGSTAMQSQILSSTKNATIKDIAIWEPNSKDHVEYIIENNNKLTDGSGTIDDADLKFENGDRVNTYAINKNILTTEPKTIVNVYDINSTGVGIQNTFKTEKKSETDYRINSLTPLDIKNISNTNFNIKANAISRIRVYIWLEGQDVDCINIASLGGGIELDLGLTKDNEIGGVMEPTLAELIVGNEATVYGQHTNYPVDIDGNPEDNDWKIFYSNGSEVFLIADDYVPNTMIKPGVMTKSTATATTWLGKNATLDKYAAYFTSDGSNFIVNNVSSEIRSKYMLLQAIPNERENYKVTANLLNTESWDNFVNESYAQSAIGGPTIEMFMESWNQKYEGNASYSKLTYAWNNKGYKIGTTEPTENRITGILGYDNASLFFPRATDEDVIIEIDENEVAHISFGYWLASPSANNSGYVLRVNRMGGIYGAGYSSASMQTNGVRPVVCLKSDIQATKDENDVWILKSK